MAKGRAKHSDSSMQVFVGVAGRRGTLVLTVRESEDVAELQGRIRDKEGIPIEQQRLTFGA
eukprot:2358435-Rhodomonas_salina.1